MVVIVAEGSPASNRLAFKKPGIMEWMRCLRALVFCLVAGVAGAPTLLDACLFGCDAEETVQSAPCHAATAAVPTGPRAKALPHCAHEHQQAWMEAREPRPTSNATLSPALTAIAAVMSRPSLSVKQSDPHPAASAAPTPPSFSIPLRL
jgi:hypothetical protein